MIDLSEDLRARLVIHDQMRQHHERGFREGLRTGLAAGLMAAVGIIILAGTLAALFGANP